VRGDVSGVSEKMAWRGPRPDEDLSVGAMIASWLRLLPRDNEDAFCMLIESRRVLLVSRCGGRTATLHESFDLERPTGLAARLHFLWRHRASFVDGISVVDSVIMPVEEVRLRGDRGVLLVPEDGEGEVLLEPSPSILVGRALTSEVVLAHRLVARRQATFHSRPDGWYVADADSVSGTWLEGDSVRKPTPLHHGALLRLGGLTVEVVQAS
jgi:hypothetical protein